MFNVRSCRVNQCQLQEILVNRSLEMSYRLYGIRYALVIYLFPRMNCLTYAFSISN